MVKKGRKKGRGQKEVERKGAIKKEKVKKAREGEGGFSYEIINLAPLLAISPKIPLHLAFQSPNLELF